jgi:hypothetical protein
MRSPGRAPTTKDAERAARKAAECALFNRDLLIEKLH